MVLGRRIDTAIMCLLYLTRIIILSKGIRVGWQLLLYVIVCKSSTGITQKSRNVRTPTREGENVSRVYYFKQLSDKTAKINYAVVAVCHVYCLTAVQSPWGRIEKEILLFTGLLSRRKTEESESIAP